MPNPITTFTPSHRYRTNYGKTVEITSRTVTRFGNTILRTRCGQVFKIRAGAVFFPEFAVSTLTATINAADVVPDECC